MHYYSFHIGDYASHTNHLTLLEDLAYRRLLDSYYLNEGLHETCEAEIARAIGMRDNQAEVCYVLSKFFEKTDTGFSQKRIDEELAKYHAKADAARANGKKGGRPKNPDETQEKPSGLAEKSESKANHKPITNNQEPETKTLVPYQQVADAYNASFAEATGNPRIEKVTDTRKRTIKKLWYFDTNNKEENKRTNSIDYWIRYFTYLSEVPFMQSDFKRTGGHENWKPSFDFVMKEKTLIDVKEGKYDN